jgi:hypothetical protein
MRDIMESALQTHLQFYNEIVPFSTKSAFYTIISLLQQLKINKINNWSINIYAYKINNEKIETRLVNNGSEWGVDSVDLLSLNNIFAIMTEHACEYMHINVTVLKSSAFNLSLDFASKKNI